MREINLVKSKVIFFTSHKGVILRIPSSVTALLLNDQYVYVKIISAANKAVSDCTIGN